MEGEEFYGAAYKGTKQFTQKEVKTANATGFGAAADDYRWKPQAAGATGGGAR